MIPREILKKIRQIELRTNWPTTPPDVKSIGMDVLRHRVAITYGVKAEEKTSETIVQKIFERIAGAVIKTKIIFCFAFVLSGVLFGCSSIDHPSANSKQSSPNLYLHLYASFPYPEQPRLIVSTPIQLSSDFDIPMEDHQQLRGRIEPRTGNFFVHLQGRLCSGTNVFNGEVELEKRYEPWPQPYDNNAPFICQPHFILSSNPTPKLFLKQQAAAEKERWKLENPLTARQLEEVKRKFHLIRAGMTENEVFALLGLSAYRNRLLPSNHFRNRFDIGDYQLADGERLMLYFDYTGMKTKTSQFANGENLQVVDYTSNTSNRIVVRAELDSVARSNSPPVWQTISNWP